MKYLILPLSRILMIPLWFIIWLFALLIALVVLLWDFDLKTVRKEFGDLFSWRALSTENARDYHYKNIFDYIKNKRSYDN